MGIHVRLSVYHSPITDMASYPLSCSCNDDYKLVAKCCGHSGCISHLDWTLPIALPGTKLNGKMILMGVDESGNLLFWNPKTGKQSRQERSF